MNLQHLQGLLLMMLMPLCLQVCPDCFGAPCHCCCCCRSPLLSHWLLLVLLLPLLL